MDTKRRKAFLVQFILSSQEKINKIRANLEDPNYRLHMTQEDEAVAADKIDYQQANIKRYMKLLEI